MKISATRAVVWFSAPLLLCVFTAPAEAQAWDERGDAGQLPGSAQTTIGEGTLRVIRGSLGDGPGLSDNIDMFLIEIFDASTFSATTTSELIVEPLLQGDPQLFLFDANGRGVVANDDSDFGDPDPSPEASIPTPNESLPLRTIESGSSYYLAVAASTNKPYSSMGNKIFPDPFDDIYPDSDPGFEALLFPTASGGNAPVTNWATGDTDYVSLISGQRLYPDEDMEFFPFNYTVHLSGAQFAVVPEPASLTVWGLLLTGGAGAYLRRRRRNAAAPNLAP